MQPAISFALDYFTEERVQAEARYPSVYADAFTD